MALFNSRFASLAALGAALSMAATPAFAAELPAGATARIAVPAQSWDAGLESAHDYRWRGYRRHRDRIDAGDVLAGVIILGGIAAIASAASKPRQPRRDTAYRYPDQRSNPRYNPDNAMNAAVDSCMRSIERDVRVDGVDSVARSGDGWMVSGRLYDGNGFNCSVGRDGAIQRIDYGGRTLGQQDNQWNDDRYAQARRDADAQAGNGATSSYPGGPVDGDLYPGGDYPEKGG